jgi:hypothetical protein
MENFHHSTWPLSDQSGRFRLSLTDSSEISEGAVTAQSRRKNGENFGFVVISFITQHESEPMLKQILGPIYWNCGGNATRPREN